MDIHCILLHNFSSRSTSLCFFSFLLKPSFLDLSHCLTSLRAWANFTLSLSRPEFYLFKYNLFVFSNKGLNTESFSLNQSACFSGQLLKYFPSCLQCFLSRTPLNSPLVNYLSSTALHLLTHILLKMISNYFSPLL